MSLCSKSSSLNSSGQRSPAASLGPWVTFWGLHLVFLVLVSPVFGQTVATLGGGPIEDGGASNGFFDGDTLQGAQFNQPVALEFDANGLLYVVDKGNNAIRRLDLGLNRTQTILTGLNQPVDIAFDAANNLFVLEEASGNVLQFDAFLNPVRTLAGGLNHPTSLALQNDTNLFVAELVGSVKRIHIKSGQIDLLRAGLAQPKGIAVMDSGQIAVSESGGNRIRLIDPATGDFVLSVGEGVAGFRNGAPGLARFNGPEKLVQLPSGQLVVADKLNHRLRVVDGSGRVSTAYGVDPSAWLACQDCYPGWWDGDVSVVEARDPVGVAVDASGNIYVSEVYYHLIRQFSGEISTGPGGSGADLPILPPVIQPQSGYFPGGGLIQVSDPNDPGLLNRRVFYTTDGSEPTTNSFQLHLTGNAGSIVWSDSERSLTSLKIKTFIGGRSSETVTGKPAEKNEIGIPRDVFGGSGATLTLPIVVNLKESEALRSLQFRLEIEPSSASVPPIGEGFSGFGYGTNDFISLNTSDTDGSVIRYSAQPYSIGTTRGIAFSWIGTNANLSISDFGVTTLVRLPIPPSAALGDSYKLRILAPTGTSDAGQTEIELNPMPDRLLKVVEVSYLVGDAAPGLWYDAAETGNALFGFGDGKLSNADVNLAFNASLGVNVPYPFSTVFNAMDSYPLDRPGIPGGDGEIRFLDWQLTLARSLGLDPDLWIRAWVGGGSVVARKQGGPVSGGQPNTPAEFSQGYEGWFRHASLQALSVGDAEPGQWVQVPLKLKISPGVRISGMQFKAAVETDQAGLIPVSFVPNPALGGFLPAPAVLPLNQTAGAWSLFQWNPGLSGVADIGHLSLQLPGLLKRGDCIRIRLDSVDGAYDLSVPLQFETIDGCIRVGESLEPWESQQPISAQWKSHYFAGRDAWALPFKDPDLDGVSNWEEYVAGTDPTDASSRLDLRMEMEGESPSSIRLSWPSSQGRLYQIETSIDFEKWELLESEVWGDGSWKRIQTHLEGHEKRMFRLRVK